MMAVSKNLRYEVLRRDRFRCRYCGRSADEITLEVDHVTPLTLGGSDDPANLYTACYDCNRGKAASNPDAEVVSQVAEDALRWKQAMEWAAEVQAKQRGEHDAYVNAFADLWNDWRRPGGEPMWIPNDWPGSVARFQALGLELEVLARHVDTTMQARRVPERKLFNYFCGCCWKTIRERQEIAQSVLEVDEDD